MKTQTHSNDTSNKSEESTVYSEQTETTDIMSSAIVQNREQDRGYILSYGNPDPVSYSNGLSCEYEMVENGTYFTFSVSHGWDAWADPQLFFLVFCRLTDGQLSNTTVYKYASIEYLTEEGIWKRLSYLPKNIESADERWICLQADPSTYFMRIDSKNIANELTVGTYRVVVYVSGQMSDGSEKNLKYELPIEVRTLVEPDNPDFQKHPE